MAKMRCHYSLELKSAPHFQKSIWQLKTRSQIVIMLSEAVVPLLGIINSNISKMHRLDAKRLLTVSYAYSLIA